MLKTLSTLFFFSICLSKNINAHAAAQIYGVHITNSLPTNASYLDLHCQSKYDDVGFRSLYMNGEFSWNFHIGSWETGASVYSCQFWWAERNKNVIVFHHDTAFRYCSSGLSGLNCYWYVKEDGFYLGGIPKSSISNLPISQDTKKMIGW